VRRLHPANRVLFQRDHWHQRLRDASISLRLLAVFGGYGDPSFSYTSEERDMLARAAAGEDVGIEFLTPPHKARSLLRLRHVPKFRPLEET
jgi:hypothetical protein